MATLKEVKSKIEKLQYDLMKKNELLTTSIHFTIKQYQKAVIQTRINIRRPVNINQRKKK